MWRSREEDDAVRSLREDGNGVGRELGEWGIPRDSLGLEVGSDYVPCPFPLGPSWFCH